MILHNLSLSLPSIVTLNPTHNLLLLLTNQQQQQQQKPKTLQKKPTTPM